MKKDTTHKKYILIFDHFGDLLNDYRLIYFLYDLNADLHHLISIQNVIERESIKKSSKNKLPKDPQFGLFLGTDNSFWKKIKYKHFLDCFCFDADNKKIK